MSYMSELDLELREAFAKGLSAEDAGHRRKCNAVASGLRFSKRLSCEVSKAPLVRGGIVKSNTFNHGIQSQLLCSAEFIREACGGQCYNTVIRDFDA